MVCEFVENCTEPNVRCENVLHARERTSSGLGWGSKLLSNIGVKRTFFVGCETISRISVIRRDVF